MGKPRAAKPAASLPEAAAGDLFALHERNLASMGALIALQKRDPRPAAALLRDGKPLTQGFRDALAEHLVGTRKRMGRPPLSQRQKDWKAIESALARAYFDWMQREDPLPHLEALERFRLSQGLTEGQANHLLNPPREIAQLARELVQLDEEGRVASILVPREDVEPDK